jgi:hypothetical protein
MKTWAEILIVYADYAWGKQNNAVFTDGITRVAAPCSATRRTRSASQIQRPPAEDPGGEARCSSAVPGADGGFPPKWPASA